MYIKFGDEWSAGLASPGLLLVCSLKVGPSPLVVVVFSPLERKITFLSLVANGTTPA